MIQHRSLYWSGTSNANTSSLCSMFANGQLFYGCNMVAYTGHFVTIRGYHSVRSSCGILIALRAETPQSRIYTRLGRASVCVCRRRDAGFVMVVSPVA